MSGVGRAAGWGANLSFVYREFICRRLVGLRSGVITIYILIIPVY